MTYDAFFAGAGAILLGTLVGVLISCRLTYGFQKCLLKQQLEFQKALLDQQLAAEQKNHDEYLKHLEKATLSEANGGMSLRKQINMESAAIQQAIHSLREQKGDHH